MTDRDNPTTEDTETHPERLLAGYVAGELTPGEASLVDRHLSSCETCREEVHLARRARRGMATLPPLDVPAGLTRSVIDRSRARRLPSSAWAWGAGAAAAAAAVAVVLFAVLSGGGGGGAPTAARTGEQAGGGQAVASGNPFGIRQSRVNYNPARIQALAGQLSSRSFDRATSANPVAAPQLGKSATALSSETPFGCLRKAGAPVGKDRLIEIIAARFNGIPAYIGAFDHRPAPGQPPNLLTIWVSARSGCRLLHYASQALGR